MQSFSGRLFNCASCFSQAVICSHCDRGNIYCSPDCAVTARTENQKRASRRYQNSPRGRRHHAARQAAYRARLKEKVTHQGSLHLPLNDLLLLHPEVDPVPLSRGQKQVLCCCFCQTSLHPALRTGFLSRLPRPDALLWSVLTSGPS